MRPPTEARTEWQTRLNEANNKNLQDYPELGKQDKTALVQKLKEKLKEQLETEDPKQLENKAMKKATPQQGEAATSAAAAHDSC